MRFCALLGILLYTQPLRQVQSFAPAPLYTGTWRSIIKSPSHDVQLQSRKTSNEEEECVRFSESKCKVAPLHKHSVSSIVLGMVLLVSIVFMPQQSIARDDSATASTTSPPPATNGQTELSPTAMNKSRYWSLMDSPDVSVVQSTNQRLLDHAVGTITTHYYDNSGGTRFTTKDFYDRWKVLKTFAMEGTEGVKQLTSAKDVSKGGPKPDQALTNSEEKHKDRDVFVPQLFLVDGENIEVQKGHRSYESVTSSKVPPHAFDSRDDAVKSLKWLVSTLDDPYSKYMTRDDLEMELKVRDDGFLGLGAVVETPQVEKAVSTSTTAAGVPDKNGLLTLTRVSNLPKVTGIAPDSPAERAGIVVGDRIAAVGSDKFIGLGRDEVVKRLNDIYTGAENYVGYPDLTIAKPVLRTVDIESNAGEQPKDDVEMSGFQRREQLMGYKLSRVRLPTVSVEPFKPYKSTNALLPEVVPPASAASDVKIPVITGGDNVVHWELLTPSDSIFQKYMSSPGVEGANTNTKNTDRVGYIRFTRFSRLSSAGYINAVNELEAAGAQSFIIDVRNCYGGIIQESMLTASSLLRDPHTVLCYTLNSRGGFTPHDVEEYIVDTRYPGYLLSSEGKDVSYEIVKRDDPEFVKVDENGISKWVPPSSYASIREQKMKRNYNRPTGIAGVNPFDAQYSKTLAADEIKQLRAQKKIVILMNEGTASAAEVFVSSLRSNGRTVALVGTNTYGKGLIQHTFPMPDGGGLRLTVAEYLTPSLQHVTKVGGAQYDRNTGDFVGGGVSPDIYCPSNQGIPSRVGADICVGMALDALEEASVKELASYSDSNDDGMERTGRRRTVGAGSQERYQKGLIQR